MSRRLVLLIATLMFVSAALLTTPLAGKAQLPVVEAGQSPAELIKSFHEQRERVARSLEGVLLSAGIASSSAWPGQYRFWGALRTFRVRLQ